MIEFMLDDARPQTRRAETDLLSARVVTAHLNSFRPRHVDLDVRQAEAAFHKFSGLAGLLDFRVGQAKLPPLDGANEHALFNGHLGAGQSDGRMTLHHQKHFLDEIAQTAVKTIHWPANGAQDGIWV